MSNLELRELFVNDPTRDLEEVQKVNAVTEAERDIEEFHVTPSVARVLEALGELVVDNSAGERFMYLHATFGSGKTHLLKLIGYATGHASLQDPEKAAEIGRKMGQIEEFKELRQRFDQARSDRFIPVFLNLLDRDASAEPPIPLLIYRALARRLGYPTEPAWLMELAYVLDTEHGLWEGLRDVIVDDMSGGMGFEEAYKNRGLLRSWLYRAVQVYSEQTVKGDSRPSFRNEQSVERAIEDAVEAVSPENFTAEKLADRIQGITEHLESRDGDSTELLLGLDEVALFIGDDRTRYEEFHDTVETLAEKGVNPVIVGTGQWSLASIHKEFLGEPDRDAWYSNEVELEGTDTEIIVRKRWLRKKKDKANRVADVLEDASEGVLTANERDAIGDSDSSAVESYPFRPTDLRHVREVMQNLMSGGRRTRREYVQGRALLVQVRALFTEHGWADRSLGNLVPWPELFDLLATETKLIQSWVRELLDQIDSTVGDKVSRVIDVAKVIYLLNRCEEVPATADNVVRFLVENTGTDLDALREEVDTALEVLCDDKHYLHADDGPDGAQVYRLLTEDEMSLAEKIESKADSLRLTQIRQWIKSELQQDEPLLLSERLRDEVDVGDRRNVPLRVAYTILRRLPDLRDEGDAIKLRLAASDQDIEELVEDWVGGQNQYITEDVLVALDLPSGFETRLRRLLATDEVLRRETQDYADLRNSQTEDRRTLQNELRNALDDAAVYISDGTKIGTFSEDLEDYIAREIVPAKFQNRKTLHRPLQIAQSGDAQELHDFFQGDGEWPLAEEDAKMLLGVGQGVDGSYRREIVGGWAGEILEEYTYSVSGEKLLEEIENSGGRYLGTSLEALQAVILTLGTARRVSIKQGGKPILDPGRMANAIRSKGEVRSVNIILEAPASSNELQRMQTVYEALLGTDDTPDDPKDLVSQIENWARDNGDRVNRFSRALQREFSEREGGFDVESLQSTLDRAFRGESLDRDALVDEDLAEQAELYRQMAPLLVGSETDKWETFKSTFETLFDEYRTNPVTEDFGRLIFGKEPPTVEKVNCLLEKAESPEDYVSTATKTPAATGSEASPEAGGLAGDSSSVVVEEETETRQRNETEIVQKVVDELAEYPEGTVVLIED